MCFFYKKMRFFLISYCIYQKKCDLCILFLAVPHVLRCFILVEGLGNGGASRTAAPFFILRSCSEGESFFKKIFTQSIFYFPLI